MPGFYHSGFSLAGTLSYLAQKQLCANRDADRADSRSASARGAYISRAYGRIQNSRRGTSLSAIGYGRRGIRAANYSSSRGRAGQDENPARCFYDNDEGP